MLGLDKCNRNLIKTVEFLLKIPEERKLLLGKAKKFKDADDTYKKNLQ